MASGNQLKLPRQLARELTYLDAGTKVDWPDCLPLEITEVVENRHTGEERRWTSIHEIVLRTQDRKLWRRLYERGLTESQQGYEFDGEGEEIPFDECKRESRLVWDYKPIARG